MVIFKLKFMTQEEKEQLKSEIKKELIADLKSHLKIFGERNKKYGYHGEICSDDLKLEILYGNEVICNWTIDL
jgi:hypothetical protein